MHEESPDPITAELGRLIRTIPDFPKPGILFRDITPLLADADGLRRAVHALASHVEAWGGTSVLGMEARGFIFGAAAAIAAGTGFVPVRRPGKLPVATIGTDYALEYGTGRLEIDPTLVPPGSRVVIVDDLIATGGTALAAVRLAREAGAEVVGAAFVIDLPDLGGAARLTEEGVPVASLLRYSGH